MHLKPYSYKKLPFSELFQSYVDNFDKVANFYEINPLNSNTFSGKAESLNFTGNRKQVASLLKQFNKPFQPDDEALANIEHLKEPDSLALVTGQQLGLYGGPLYTIFKTLTVIHLADKLEEQLNRPVIPVFWLADEDHDYDEVRTIQVSGKNGAKEFSLPELDYNPPPVSDIPLPDEIEALHSNLRESLADTDFSDDLWYLLSDCFCPGKSFRHAFGSLITRLFSKHGLVLAGSHNKSIKNVLKEGLIRSVEKSDEINQALEQQSQKIDEGFHQQATITASHLFYLHPEKGRLKIQHENDTWTTEADQEWTTNELIEEIEQNPERFSPDVFLRPILQDKFLPVFGYVAGPGEIAYYAQMKTAYQEFNQQMPVFFPRLSATFIEPAIDRIFGELPFEMEEYNQRIEDLESEFTERSADVDIEAIFSGWKENEQAITSKQIEKISDIDETLKGTAKSAQSTYFNELNKLKGKTYQAVKKREKIQLNRIRRIQRNLFPGRQLQERTFCGIYYMNKFGLDIWDRLLDELEGTELDAHQLIYL